MKTAIIYTRVSTERQAGEGVSLEAQEAKARAWAEANDYHVVATLTDAGISGKSTKNRPGIQEAIRLACEHQAALVVYSLSRFARSTRDALELTEKLAKCGADLVSLTEKIDTTSAAGKLTFRLFAVLAEFERDLASERTAAALAHKKARGEKTGGYLPFGYRNENGKLVEDEDEQATIRTIRSLHADGHTLREISRRLEANGIVARASSRWSPQSIANILNRK